MNRARFGLSASKCGANSALPMRLAAIRSCWALTTTAGTAMLSRTRWTDARTGGVRLAAASRQVRRVGAGQVEQVLALDVVELQCPGDRVEHALGRAADVAALEPGVVVEADTGELGDLFAPQTRYPPFTAVVGMPACSGVTFARREIRNSRMSSLLLMASWYRSGPGGSRRTPPSAGVGRGRAQRVRSTLVARRSSIAL